MTLLRVNNKPAASFGSIFDNLFSDMERSFGLMNRAGIASFIPATNVVEKENGYELHLSAPGREKDKFALEVADGTLSVSYQHQTEMKNEDGMLLRREFSMESFKRSFQLDESIDAENISARYENGILILWLPKKPELKPASRQISIQ